MSKSDKKENKKIKKEQSTKIKGNNVIESPTTAEKSPISPRVQVVLNQYLDHLINRKHSNLTLSFDNTLVQVHKYIIDIRCKKLLEIAVPKKKKNVTIYEIRDIDSTVSGFILTYIYSDFLDATVLQESECVKVMKAASELGLERLVQKTEKLLQQYLNVGNLFQLLKLSHDISCERAKKICLEFCVMHHSEFITDQRVREIPIEIFQDEAVLHEQLKQKISEGWSPASIVETEPSTYIQDFKALFDSMEGSDGVFIFNKKPIKCHRAIVAHSSPKLLDVMDQKDPIVLPKEFGNITAETFEAYLSYIYYRNVEFSPNLAAQLIPFAKLLDMDGLVDICEEKIQNGIDEKTVLKILELAYNPILKDKEDLQNELKHKCKSFFLNNIQEIDVEPLRGMKASITVDLLTSIQKELANSWTLVADSNVEVEDSSQNLDQSIDRSIDRSMDVTEDKTAEEKTNEEKEEKSQKEEPEQQEEKIEVKEKEEESIKAKEDAPESEKPISEEEDTGKSKKKEKKEKKKKDKKDKKKKEKSNE